VSGIRFINSQFNRWPVRISIDSHDQEYNDAAANDIRDRCRRPRPVAARRIRPEIEKGRCNDDVIIWLIYLAERKLTKPATDRYADASCSIVSSALDGVARVASWRVAALCLRNLIDRRVAGLPQPCSSATIERALRRREYEHRAGAWSRFAHITSASKRAFRTPKDFCRACHLRNCDDG